MDPSTNTYLVLIKMESNEEVTYMEKYVSQTYWSLSAVVDDVIRSSVTLDPFAAAAEIIKRF